MPLNRRRIKPEDVQEATIGEMLVQKGGRRTIYTGKIRLKESKKRGTVVRRRITNLRSAETLVKLSRVLRHELIPILGENNFLTPNLRIVEIEGEKFFEIDQVLKRKARQKVILREIKTKDIESAKRRVSGIIALARQLRENGVAVPRMELVERNGTAYLAIKPLLKKRSKTRRMIFKSVDSLEEGQREVHIGDILRDAGLPVPKMGAMNIRTPSGQTLPYIVVEPFTTAGRSSKLIPVNTMGRYPQDQPEPYFLSTLRKRKHGKLIQALAKDFVIMMKSKIKPKHIDFWGFYTRADPHATLDRVIFDLDQLEHHPEADNTNIIWWARELLPRFKQYFWKEEYQLFEQTVREEFLAAGMELPERI